MRRVEKKVVKEQVAIPCDTVYKSSSLLRNGRSMLITEGTNGLAENTYEELWSGDTLVSRVLVSTKEVTAPRSALVIGRPARRGDLPAGLERPIPAGRQWHPGEL